MQDPVKVNLKFHKTRICFIHNNFISSLSVVIRKFKVVVVIGKPDIPRERGAASGQRTAPTAPPDTTGPSVSALGLTTGVINETGFEFCVAPFTSTATATITDPSGVASVAITWSGNGDNGAASMAASGSTWSGTLGPVSDNPGLAYGQSATITWTVTALDAVGNATSVSGPSLTVQGC